MQSHVEEGRFLAAQNVVVANISCLRLGLPSKDNASVSHILRTEVLIVYILYFFSEAVEADAPVSFQDEVQLRDVTFFFVEVPVLWCR